MTNTVSKTQQLVEAARKRKQAEEELAKETATAKPRAADNMTEEQVDGLRNKAEEQAATKVQAVAGSLAGIDIEAMGDVKGDGGDAKDYKDSDPAKALGVPVYEHGLNATKDGVDVLAPALSEARVFGERHSQRTQAELDRGAAAIEGARHTRAEASRSTRTVVTNAEDDPDGEKAKAALAAKEAEDDAKKKAAASKK